MKKIKDKKISEEIYERRKELRELDKLMLDMHSYFIKVEDKLKGTKKMLKRITWFILGIIIGTVLGWQFFELVLEFIKSLI